jgi:hypothetical protein
VTLRIAGLLLSAALLMAQRTDRKVYPEPPAPVLPRAGNTFVDPTFGTTLLRLTGPADGDECHNQYSYWPTFNSDSTRLFVTCSYRRPGETWTTTDTLLYRFDPAKFKLAGGKKTLDLRRAGEGIPEIEDAVWSSSRPDVLFAHDGSSLYAIDVANQKTTRMKDFGRPFAPRRLRQMSKSGDDDVFAFSLQNQGQPDWAIAAFFVWSRSRDRVLLYREVRHDEVRIDKTGRYLSVNALAGTPKGIQDQVYDLESGAREDLTDGPPDYAFDHSDYGAAIVVGFENWTPRLTERSLARPHRFRTLMGPLHIDAKTVDWSQSGHVSLLADDESWALISLYVSNRLPSSNLFRNEILQVATDGSGRVRRLAHHHSVVKEYWDSPRANISKDGRFVAFTSNWGGSGRRDVFLLRVPAASAR